MGTHDEPSHQYDEPMSGGSMPRSGAEAFWYLVGVSVVLALIWNFWYIGLILLGVLAVLWFATRPKPKEDINSPDAQAHRVHVFQTIHSLRPSLGERHFFLVSQAADLIASRKAIQQAELADWIHAGPAEIALVATGLEHLALARVDPSTGKVSRTATPSRCAETAAIIRAVLSPPPHSGDTQDSPS